MNEWLGRLPWKNAAVFALRSAHAFIAISNVLRMTFAQSFGVTPAGRGEPDETRSDRLWKPRMPKKMKAAASMSQRASCTRRSESKEAMTSRPEVPRASSVVEGVGRRLSGMFGFELSRRYVTPRMLMAATRMFMIAATQSLFGREGAAVVIS